MGVNYHDIWGEMYKFWTLPSGQKPDVTNGMFKLWSEEMTKYGEGIAKASANKAMRLHKKFPIIDKLIEYAEEIQQQNKQRRMFTEETTKDYKPAERLTPKEREICKAMARMDGRLTRQDKYDMMVSWGMRREADEFKKESARWGLDMESKLGTFNYNNPVWKKNLTDKYPWVFMNREI